MDNQVIAHGAEVRLVQGCDYLLDAKSGEDKTKSANNLKELKKTNSIPS